MVNGEWKRYELSEDTQRCRVTAGYKNTSLQMSLELQTRVRGNRHGQKKER